MISDLFPAMAATLERSLEDTVLVSARVRSRTASGGSTYTWPTQVEHPGRLSPTSSQEMEVAGRMGVTATHTCILPASVPVSVEDKLTVDGIEYSITGVLTPNPIMTKVLCARTDR